MSALTPARPDVAQPPIDLTPTAHVSENGRAAGDSDAGELSDDSDAGELSDDDLEAVVGGLARTWTDALRASRHQA